MKQFMISLSLIATMLVTASCHANKTNTETEANEPIMTDSIISDAAWEQADRVDYSFYDSSVAPEYHRSYTLTMTKEKATISVNSYGDVLLEAEYVITEEQFQQAIDGLRKLNIRSHKKNEDAIPCDGGTSESFELTADGKALFHGYQDNCGEELSTMIVGSEAIAQALNVAYPKPVRELVDSTIEEVIIDEEEE